jgi:CheY-like chemotaxis protein
LELARILRDRHPDLPVAVMTAYPLSASRGRAMAAGATEYLTKPFDEKDLERWLIRVIEAPA